MFVMFLTCKLVVVILFTELSNTKFPFILMSLVPKFGLIDFTKKLLVQVKLVIEQSFIVHLGKFPLAQVICAKFAKPEKLLELVLILVFPIVIELVLIPELSSVFGPLVNEPSIFIVPLTSISYSGIDFFTPILLFLVSIQTTLFSVGLITLSTIALTLVIILFCAILIILNKYN